jgi:general secretion pathway protein J
MRETKASPGFTLLELIVTFTIMSLVFLMMFGALRLGSAAWERGEERVEKYQRRRVVSHLLSQQIKSAVAYKIRAQKAEADYLAFLGESDSLRFISTFSIKAKRPEGLVFVIYRLADGKSPGKTLRVFEKRVLNKDFLEESPKEEAFLSLVEGVSDLKFEYFDPGKEKEDAGEWFETWDAKEKKRLPSQVRMTMKWKERKEEAEIALPVLVALPAYQYDDRGRAGMPIGSRPMSKSP